MFFLELKKIEIGKNISRSQDIQHFMSSVILFFNETPSIDYLNETRQVQVCEILLFQLFPNILIYKLINVIE